MRRLGVRVPHGAPMKIVLRQKSYFYCKNIKSVGTRTRKGRCIRENVQWTFEQQRLQTCEACAGGRMHSIRKSPSWRANKNSSSAEELFLLQAYQISRDSNPKGLLHQRECPMDIRTAASPNMRSMCRRPDAQHTEKSLMARQIKNTHRKVSVFDLHAYHSIFCIFSRMRPRTFFSILDTCTCDIPSTDAICCCVISRKYRSTII